MEALTCEIRERGGDGVLAVRVEFDRYDGERAQFVYSLTYAGETIASGNDLRSGSGADVDHRDMLATLLTFFEAAGESYSYHGPGDADHHGFSEKAAGIAYGMSDEITLARLELEDDETA